AFQPVEVSTEPGEAVGIAAFHAANDIPAKHMAAIAPVENSMPFKNGRDFPMFYKRGTFSREMVPHRSK
ncbi:MAG: hypothetical protein QMC36_07530, partial [Patescibacteria group bacterium]